MLRQKNLATLNGSRCSRLDRVEEGEGVVENENGWFTASPSFVTKQLLPSTGLPDSCGTMYQKGKIHKPNDNKIYLGICHKIYQMAVCIESTKFL
jgi:hypothetical protein